MAVSAGKSGSAIPKPARVMGAVIRWRRLASEGGVDGVETGLSAAGGEVVVGGEDEAAGAVLAELLLLILL